jgi:ubiquinone/menaquinone biosynthesis C-methylase UbiE
MDSQKSLRNLIRLRSQKKRTHEPQKFYDQIADVQPFMQKLMGYRNSLARYLRSLKLNLSESAIALDAGCGTGLTTFALYSAGYRPKIMFTLDISFNSLRVAREDFRKDKHTKRNRIEPIQGNLLHLPFEDETFDFIVTCGALEYVPLDEGISELARVLKSKSKMILIPVLRSPVSAVLEVIYKFKAYPTEQIYETASRYFHKVEKHEFPITEPIGWSKISFVLEKR